MTTNAKAARKAHQSQAEHEQMAQIIRQQMANPFKRKPNLRLNKVAMAMMVMRV